jgi:aminoglycoside phosphotransferase (APT) family kinase protein
MNTSPELRPAGSSVVQDWARLAAYLAEQDFRLALDPPPRQFAGGLANLNFLVQIDGREAVLRRPPLGTLPPGAYDMGRGFRILNRLWSGFPLAPRGLLLCTDSTVLGAPFQIVEYRRGFAVRSVLPSSLAAITDIGQHLSDILGNVLVALHNVVRTACNWGSLAARKAFWNAR